jgi:ABC-type lipoprotein release transport system permease subunit
MSGLPFGITPGDPVTCLMAGTMFFALALAAVVIPASRASRVAPVTALRWE